jgi:SAM-dependent methyltransferase
MSQSLDPRYLSGQRLYGDDFTAEQVDRWFADEAEAYVELYAGNPRYEYGYRAVNVRHGFRHLPRRPYATVLGLGSGYGDELSPIQERIGRLIIIESSEAYRAKPALTVPTDWRAATPDGSFDLSGASVDLATCFGVLHHIPNVRRVVLELGRVIRPEGYLLLREPIISMGDWTRPRAGLTPHERGIPLRILRSVLREAEFQIKHETLCFFTGTSVLARYTHTAPFDHASVVALDAVASRVMRFNYRYHATRWWQRIRPTSVFVVARRR